MISVEELALLYNSTQDKQNKERIFRKIYNDIEREAFSLCHFYRKFFSSNIEKEVFFEEAMQEARLVLVRCIEKFDEKRNAKLSTFYRTCLSNHLRDYFRKKIDVNRNEIIDTSVFSWLNDSDNDIELDVYSEIDNKSLYNLLNKYLDNLEYTKPIHKNIFKDYIGFSDKSSQKESFGTIAERYKLSRTAIKKIVDKYFDLLKTKIIENGDIEKIKEFL